MKKNIPNNTGWEVGEEYLFKLDNENKFFMHASVEYNYYALDKDGRISIAEHNNPFNVCIHALVRRKTIDEDGEEYYQAQFEYDQKFLEQAQFWRYCASIKREIAEDKEYQELEKMYMNNKYPLNKQS